MEPVRIAILTVSDGVAAGTRQDRSGEALVAWSRFAGFTLAHRDAVADEGGIIAARLAAWCDGGDVDVIVTTGGTGFTDRDVTPEATRAVVEREAPGIAEALRIHGAKEKAFAWLARGIAGIRGRTLIVNLPGSEGGVRDGVAVLDALVPHAVQLLRGVRTAIHDVPPAS